MGQGVEVGQPSWGNLQSLVWLEDKGAGGGVGMGVVGVLLRPYHKRP